MQDFSNPNKKPKPSNGFSPTNSQSTRPVSSTVSQDSKPTTSGQSYFELLRQDEAQQARLNAMNQKNSDPSESSKLDKNLPSDLSNPKISTKETSQENPPKSSTKSSKNSGENNAINMFIASSLVAVILSLVFGSLAGYGAYSFLERQNSVSNPNNSSTSVIEETERVRTTIEESAIIDVVNNNLESVVSIVISQDLQEVDDLFRRSDPFGFFIPDSNSNQRRQIGSGTGFLVSDDGFIVTNRHVVEETNASYTVVFEDGNSEEAKVLARDSLLDIAILKIETDRILRPVEFGNSDAIQVGQSVIAIGNSLGEFSNTVSRGIVSGLGRSIVASNEVGQNPQQLDDVIQTDASINPGNSGGPLLDITGKVIGVNVARAGTGENIAFSIPANLVTPIIESVRETGRIQRPFLGIRYIDLNPQIADENNLDVDYGAFLSGGDSSQESAIAPGSPAEKAGLQEGDVILAINGVELRGGKTLRTEIRNFTVGDVVTLTIFRNGNEQKVNLTLESFPEI